MPHIRCRALTMEQVEKLSATLPKMLAPVIQTPEDNFTVERIETLFFQGGQTTQSFPFVEVHWFPRTQEVQNETALHITKEVRRITGAEDIVVVFQKLEKSAYYENGQHF